MNLHILLLMIDYFFTIYVLQLVHPSYIEMLEHLRSNAFENFKRSLEKLVGKGEGFAASVRTCQQSSLLEFDRGCSGAAYANFIKVISICHQLYILIIQSSLVGYLIIYCLYNYQQLYSTAIHFF